MNNLGKICGILSGIISAIIIYILGADALQKCLLQSGSSVVVIPSGEWFSQIYSYICKYGIYVLSLLALSQILVGKTKNGAGILFIFYVVISICFIAVIFFPDKVINILK